MFDGKKGFKLQYPLAFITVYGIFSFMYQFKNTGLWLWRCFTEFHSKELLTKCRLLVFLSSFRFPVFPKTQNEDKNTNNRHFVSKSSGWNVVKVLGQCFWIYLFLRTPLFLRDLFIFPNGFQFMDIQLYFFLDFKLPYQLFI